MGPGSDHFMYKWRKVSDTLPSTVEGENTPNLTIRSVMPSDSGSYYCTVVNQWGSMIKSNKTTVNVLCKFFIRHTMIYYICLILLHVYNNATKYVS